MLPPVLVHFQDPNVGRLGERELVDGKQAVRIYPRALTFDVSPGVTCTRTQLPLISSFACTIHKAQGLTLPKVVVDCGRAIFQGGMAYTALSRVRKFEDLILLNFEPLKIFCLPRVKREFERLELWTQNPVPHFSPPVVPEPETNTEMQEEVEGEPLDWVEVEASEEDDRFGESSRNQE